MVDEMETAEICELIESKGFVKVPKSELPSPDEDEDDEEGSGDEEYDGPGMEEEDPELRAFREGRVPGAPAPEEQLFDETGSPGLEEKEEL